MNDHQSHHGHNENEDRTNHKEEDLFDISHEHGEHPTFFVSAPIIEEKVIGTIVKTIRYSFENNESELSKFQLLFDNLLLPLKGVETMAELARKLVWGDEES